MSSDASYYNFCKYLQFYIYCHKLNSELIVVTKAKERWIKEECDDTKDLKKNEEYNMLHTNETVIVWMNEKTNTTIRKTKLKDGEGVCKKDKGRPNRRNMW